MSLSPADRALRREGITATDAAALSGLHPYRTALDVYRSKVGDPDREDDLSESLRVQLGHAAEPLLCARLAKETGLVLRPANTERHPFETWILATPDRDVVTEGDEKTCAGCRGEPTHLASCSLCLGKGRSNLTRVAVAEAKLVEGSDRARAGHRVLDHWKDDDGAWCVADYVEVQVQWQMLARRVPYAYVAALLGGQWWMTAEPIERSDDVTSALVEICGDFWRNNVLARVPPPIDASERTAKMLRACFRKHRPDLLPMPPDVRALAEEYERARLAEKEAKVAMARAKHEACLRIADCAGFRDEDGAIVTWKGKVGSVSYKDAFEHVVDVARERGVSISATEILAEHRGEGERAFRVALPKTEEEGEETEEGGERAA